MLKGLHINNLYMHKGAMKVLASSYIGEGIKKVGGIQSLSNYAP
jgi:hypothetical protein